MSRYSVPMAFTAENPPAQGQHVELQYIGYTESGKTHGS